ncbi:MAG: hypothetical protein KJ571_10930 [Bacteroidetes bacterium]|nr:hypothetical protein [Bacteroidota bacterium]
MKKAGRSKFRNAVGINLLFLNGISNFRFYRVNKMKNFLRFVLAVIAILNFYNTIADAQNLDLNKVPFSTAGSYFAISTLLNRVPQDTLYINHFLGYDTRQVFKIIPIGENNEELKYTVRAFPWMIGLNSESSQLQICFENPKTIRLKSQRKGFKLTSGMIRYPIPMPGGKQFRLMGKDRYDRFMITCISGGIDIKKVGNEYEIIVTALNESCELAIEEYVSEWEPREYKMSFEDCKNKVENNYEAFIAKASIANNKYIDAKKLALFINWSSTVYQRGFMRREGMLMSKNWMNYIWSWDNCFNAIGMAGSFTDLAWDQVMVVLENQDELGILPDRFMDVFIHYGFTKPPVYGYTIDQLEKIPGVMNLDRYKEVYPYLVKLTEFWLKYRDDNKNMLPEYHHGNDSGWDNGTVFDIGFPVEGPDLSSFLIIQMDKLSEIALKLNLKEDSYNWKLKADNLYKKLMNEFWIDGKFVYRNSITNLYDDNSSSLLPYIPIALGRRLPEEVREKLISDLKNSGIITKYGPATENPLSPKYAYDSYWRGPIWAPSTYIIVEGLNDCGEKELAKEIAIKFCDLCLKNGFAENYDAVSGTPFRDQAYTWTASVFLSFLDKYSD